MNADWSTTWIDNEHPALRRCWHPVARSADVGDDQPVAVDLLGERWCLVRLGGELAALRDPCPHRHSSLSAGTIEGDTIADTVAFQQAVTAENSVLLQRIGTKAVPLVVRSPLWQMSPPEPIPNRDSIRSCVSCRGTRTG